MGDAPPLDEDAPDEALLVEDGRSSPTSVGRVRKRAQIGAQLARGWERGVAPLRRRLARSCCCLQTRSGSTSARLRGWGGETMLAGTRIPHHPHVRAHHAAIPPHSQAPSPSDAATPSGGLADDERDEAAAPPGWPARASRWPVQRGGVGSPILARALADARRSREKAKCGKSPCFYIAQKLGYTTPSMLGQGGRLEESAAPRGGIPPVPRNRPVFPPFTATSRRNESDRRLAACTSVCALQFYTESILGTSSQSLVERSYGHSPLVCNDVEHCSTSLNTIE